MFMDLLTIDDAAVVPCRRINWITGIVKFILILFAT